ncbi:hypothetical protein Tco_1174064 [Tanacetum coccineum]
MHRRHRETKLKGKAVANAPNVAPPETGCKSIGATSISKRIIADRKGKAIVDPNNVATTKTRLTTTDATANVDLRLLSKRTRSKQYNAPTVAEVAALIINDFGDGEPIKDIVVCKKDIPPKRISELHPSYMALQYHLLFPYGEDSYHEKILYHTNKGKRKTTKDYVTMKEYYAYVIQYRKDQGDTNDTGLGKRIVLPISFTSGLRCKATTDIDDIISAELPSLTDDPAGYKAVSDYMLHEPCGKDNKAATCNVEGKCSKHFLKPFYAETVIDEDGYPIYRRRDDKVSIKKGSTSGIRACALRNFNLKVMEFETTQNNTTAKLPILKLENGNSWVSVPQTSQDTGTSVTKMSVPVTAEENICKKNDVKARSL